MTQGLKYDQGKLPTHLLAPEVFLIPHTWNANDAPAWQQSVYYLAQWWARQSDSLGLAFATMMRALEKELGFDPSAHGDACAHALEAVCRVLAFGANKYAERNWEAGFAYSRAYGAVLRHVFAFASGESHDPETGEHHISHAACEVMFLLAWDARGFKHFDDRPGGLVNAVLIDLPSVDPAADYAATRVVSPPEPAWSAPRKLTDADVGKRVRFVSSPCQIDMERISNGQGDSVVQDVLSETDPFYPNAMTVTASGLGRADGTGWHADALAEVFE